MSTGSHPIDIDDAPGSLRELQKLEAKHPALRREMDRDYSVSHRFDMPFTAGYSVDRRHFYFDRHLPLIASIQMDDKRKPLKSIHIVPFYLLHEQIEAALQRVLSMPHEEAHHLATAAEYEKVRHAGLDLSSYRKWSAQWIKADEIRDSRITNLRIPPDFDTTPLEADSSHKGKALLEKVREAMASTRRSARSFGRQKAEAK